MTEGRADQAYALYEEGRSAIDRGDRALGIQRLRDAATLAPHYKTFELLGECLAEEGRKEEAIVFLAAAAGLGHRQFRSRFLLAKSLLSLGPGWESEAAQKLKECLRLNPQYKAARELLDQILGQDDALAKRLAEDDKWEESKGGSLP